MPVAANGTTPKPKIFSRAQWGANEKMRDKGSLRYGEVHAAFVHHTVNANNYSKADVPAILRGIYAYHVNGRGWSDIGYNFLVDRFGRIWEGRFGGVARPGVGAHTLGFNDYATAMSAIGNFETVKPSAAMLDAYARLWAWKLSLHGIKADSTKQWVGSRYFPAINGHRDAAKTACPGRYLYAKLGEIRTKAAEYQRSFDSRNLAMNISGSKWPDIAARDKVSKRLVVIRTGGQVRYAPRSRSATVLPALTWLSRSETSPVTADRMCWLEPRARESPRCRRATHRASSVSSAPTTSSAPPLHSRVWISSPR